MAGGTDDASLRVLFGKGFLIRIERGDLEHANLFARGRSSSERRIRKPVN